MSEKLAEVYEQYDMEILSSRKGRGATILNTSKGIRILEPFRGNVTRLEQEYVLKCVLAAHGCDYVDLFILNKEEQLLTYDKYRQPYVLKVHFEGEECDMHDIENICKGIALLAKFHLKGQEVLADFNMSLQQLLEEKEQKRIVEIRQAMENGEELEKLASLYEISGEALEKIFGENNSNKNMEETNLDCQKISEGFNDNNTHYGDKLNSVENLFLRHNQELKKIQRYMMKVKRKNEFEKTYLSVCRQFYDKGLESYCLLQNLASEIKNASYHFSHYGICHGNFNQHNIIFGEHVDGLVHFEKFSKGNQLNDLYQFSRKVMEKNSFDFSILEEIFHTYEREIPLVKEDYQYIYILFSYPEKFWKIANSYYNTNKAFLSPKYIEKLETVIAQESEREKMLDAFKNKLLLFN
ncbi:MAG: hypothetical protein ACI4F4_03240 [Lachnospiraceae bacterium]